MKYAALKLTVIIILQSAFQQFESATMITFVQWAPLDLSEPSQLLTFQCIVAGSSSSHALCPGNRPHSMSQNNAEKLRKFLPQTGILPQYGTLTCSFNFS